MGQLCAQSRLTLEEARDPRGGKAEGKGPWARKVENFPHRYR